MEEPIRILHVFAGLDRGGAETVIINLYRQMDRSKVQFDFVVNDNPKVYAYEEEVKELGGRVFRIPRFHLSNVIIYRRTWKQLLITHPEWKVIHSHHTSNAIIYFTIARKMKRVTIAHSHTASADRSLKAILKYLIRLPLRYYANYLFACSKQSADWMFGKNNSKVFLLKNAIALEKYEFKQEVRQQKRKEFDLTDQFVVGHIGNFTKVKNYPFLLMVFQSIYQRNKNARLLLIGKKENDPNIENLVTSMKLEKAVIFAGVREDIPELLQSMDVFLFPSIYEGLPVALIEAQASGLKCFVSDTVSREAQITDQLEYVSLSLPVNAWGDQIYQYAKGYERSSQVRVMKEAGYNIKDNTGWIQEFYLTLYAMKANHNN